MTVPEIAEAAQGNWWKRRKTWQKVLLIILAVLIGLSVLGSVLPEPEEEGGESASGAATTEATTTEGDNPEETTTTAEGAEATTTTVEATTTTVEDTTTTVAETTTTQPDLPGIGDAVRDGKFEFVVTGMEEPGKVYDPEDLLEDEATGVWFIVFLTVENIGDVEQTFFAGDQKVLWDDKEFTADGFAWNGTNVESLNPGLILEATVMFDVPESFPEAGVGTVLELHDSAFSGGVNVYL